MDLLNQLSASQQELRTIDAQMNADDFSAKVASQFDMVGKIFIAMTTMVEEIRNTKSGDVKEKGRTNLGESKCVSSLKILGSDKADFKNWNEKLINAIAQVLGTEWRKFLKNLNEKLDQDRKVIGKLALSDISGAENLENMDQANEDMFYVLVEKTEGEAALRVNSSGAGLEAYQKVYLWFAGTTGLALSERTRMLINPEAPRREEDIADALEKWCEQERLLPAHGEDYKLSAAFKVTALKVLMNCKKEQFETMERESKAISGDKLNDEMFKDLLARIREFAANRRLEAAFKKNKGDPMDVGQVESSSLSV